MDFQPNQIIDILDQAAHLNRGDPFRQGHLIQLPDYGQVIMTGDFHGYLVNFKKLQWYADLERSFLRHVIIHELIHSNGRHPEDGIRQMEEDCSCMLLIEAAKWKIEFPDQVHFLLGNHDLAQITAREISKGGTASIANFNKWIFSQFGAEAGAKIIEKISEFLISFPLATKCANRLWFSHSLPSPLAMDDFDFSIFDRDWRAEDMIPRGSVYETVWGRSHYPDQLKELADILNVDFFVLGHQGQEEGYAAFNDRLIILASDHGQGCFLPIDLSKRYPFHDLVSRIKFFTHLPDLPVRKRKS
jgi:hypothetical protein